MAGFGARDLAAAQVTVIPGEVLVLLPDAVAERVTIKKTPKYPAIAKAAKVEGIVRLVVRITEAGAVEPLRLLAGNPMLDVAAIEGLRAWRFNPSLSPTGQPIAVEVVVDVVFVDAAVHETVRQEFAGTERVVQDCVRAAATGAVAAEIIPVCDSALAAVKRLPSLFGGVRFNLEHAAGRAKKQAGRFDAALPHYESVLSEARRRRIGWEAAGAHFEIAQVQRALGKLPQAAEHYEEAVDRFDDGVKRQKEIVDNLTRSGRSADAASAQRAALLASLRQALEEQIEVLTELGKLKDADRASKKLTAQPTSVP